MLDPTLTSALTASAETALNRLLDYDPATRARLQKLQGRSLAVEISELKLCLCAYFETDGVRISTIAEQPDTTLSGSLPALLRLAQSDRATLADSGVRVRGDMDLLIAVRAIVNDMELDWEQAISDRFGDLAGHQLAAGIRSQWHWLREREASGRRLVGEFLTEELRAIPGALELQHFSQQVDDLRLDCDRLQARVQRLRRAISDRDN